MISAFCLHLLPDEDHGTACITLIHAAFGILLCKSKCMIFDYEKLIISVVNMYIMVMINHHYKLI